MVDSKDQQRHHRLVTRPVTTQAHVRAGQTPEPGTVPRSQLRYAGLEDRACPP